MSCILNWWKWSLWWTVLSRNAISLFVHLFLFAFSLHFYERLKFEQTIFEKLKMSDLILCFDDFLFELLSFSNDFLSFDFVELIFLLIYLQFGYLIFDTFVSCHLNLIRRTHFDKFLSWNLFIILLWSTMNFLRIDKFLYNL